MRNQLYYVSLIVGLLLHGVSAEVYPEAAPDEIVRPDQDTEHRLASEYDRNNPFVGDVNDMSKENFNKVLSSAEAAWPSGQERIWAMVSCPGKMPLPGVIIKKSFWEGGWSSMNLELSKVEYIQARWDSYLGRWGYMMYRFTPFCFDELATDCDRPSVTTSDLVKLQAGLDYDASANDLDGTVLCTTIGSPSHESWEKLFRSSNPCYRLLALIHYDSVDLSPEELMEVYRQGLFHSCSYVEMRVLVGIAKSHDYRTEVLDLVKMYAASNPCKDDGTLGQCLTFPNIHSAIEAVLARIDKRWPETHLKLFGH